MKHICTDKCKMDIKHFVIQHKVKIFVGLFLLAVVIENLLN